MKPLRFAASVFAILIPLTVTVQAETTLHIATVNNADMTIMQGLSQRFEEENPDIKLDWKVFSENELRQLLAKSYLEQVGRLAEQDLSESPPLCLRGKVNSGVSRAKRATYLPPTA